MNSLSKSVDNPATVRLWSWLTLLRLNPCIVRTAQRLWAQVFGACLLEYHLRVRPL